MPAKKKGKKGKKRGPRKKTGIPPPAPAPMPAGVAAVPQPVPAPAGEPVPQVSAVPLELPKPVDSPQPVSLSAIRQWLRVRSVSLLQMSQDMARAGLVPGLLLPPELVSDIDNVLCSVEQLDVRRLVGSYTRLVEITLFWTSHVKEQASKIEAALEVRDAKLDAETREKLRSEGGASAVKESAVKAGKAADPDRQRLADLAAEWTTLKFQIQNILTSLRVEIIVQDSVWTQRELGYKDPSMAGAPSGPSFQG